MQLCSRLTRFLQACEHAHEAAAAPKRKKQCTRRSAPRGRGGKFRPPSLRWPPPPPAPVARRSQSTVMGRVMLAAACSCAYAALMVWRNMQQCYRGFCSAAAVTHPAATRAGPRGRRPASRRGARRPAGWMPAATCCGCGGGPVPACACRGVHHSVSLRQNEQDDKILVASNCCMHFSSLMHCGKGTFRGTCPGDPWHDRHHMSDLQPESHRNQRQLSFCFVSRVLSWVLPGVLSRRPACVQRSTAQLRAAACSSPLRGRPVSSNRGGGVSDGPVV